MEYSNEELKKIQSIEKEALNILAQICHEENIEFFLVGGTALGAIRHNGFIPWDDDIDIGMTRENYEKFLSVAPKKLPQKYYLQTPYSSKTTPYYYSKIRINGTKFIEYSNRNVPMHQGVYIDIFPFDEVPDKECDNLKQFNKAKNLNKLFVYRQSPDLSEKPRNFRRKIKACLRFGMHLLCKFIPYDMLLRTLEREFTKYNGTNQKAYACLNVPIRKAEYILKSDLRPIVQYEFEGMSMPIPNNWDKYLRTHYGNYMELPPKDKRLGHKPYLVDLSEEFTETT